MATATAPVGPGLRVAAPASRPGASRTTMAVLGTLVGLAGMEHGIGEILQGPAPPDGLLIMSWPDAAAIGTFAFANFALVLVAARAHDRLQAAMS